MDAIVLRDMYGAEVEWYLFDATKEVNGSLIASSGFRFNDGNDIYKVHENVTLHYVHNKHILWII